MQPDRNGQFSAETLFAGIIDDVALTKSQRRVVGAILRNPKLIPFADTAEIAGHAEVNNSTVVRTAQALGYRGWPDLQRELRARYLAAISSEETLLEHGTPQTPTHHALERDIANLRQTLELNTQEETEAAVTLLAEAERIIVLGLGSFAGPAAVFAHLGQTMGYRITHEGRASVHFASVVSTLGPGDVLVVINMWRTAKQVAVAAAAAREAGAKVLAITDLRRGPIADSASQLLIVPSEGISFFQSVTAATSLVYGLLAGMEAARPERSRAALRRTHQLWKDLDIYLD